MPRTSAVPQSKLPGAGGKISTTQNRLLYLGLLLAGALLQIVASAQPRLVVAVGQNFIGSTYGIDSDFVPPDCNGVPGLQYFVELINGRFSVYAKTNGLRVQTMTDRSFWAGAGLALDPAVNVSDPRLIFDSAAQRWIASAIDFDSSQSSNRFLLAISRGPDPTKNWNAVAFPADPAQGKFADFPTLGMDATAIYLAAYLFDGAVALGANTLVSIPKADLLSGNPSAANRTWFGSLSGANYGHVLQPAISFESTAGDEKVLAVGDLGLDLKAHSGLVGFAIQKAGTPQGATLNPPSFINVAPYWAPLNPPQPDSLGYCTNLDGGDARFSASVRRVGQLLYAVHSSEVSGRVAIRWYKINAADFSVLQSDTISDEKLDLFYPSIAANPTGTVVIGYNGCSLDSFVSCYAVVGSTLNDMTTFGAPILLKAGGYSYEHAICPAVSPWGDYSTTCQDPIDPNRFWLIQMYPSGSDTWSTQITEILTAIPGLAISSSATNLLLSWPGTAIGFDLQSSADLSASSWTTVKEPTTSTNGMVYVKVPITGGAQFFRLHQHGPGTL